MNDELALMENNIKKLVDVWKEARDRNSHPKDSPVERAVTRVQSVIVKDLENLLDGGDSCL